MLLLSFGNLACTAPTPAAKESGPAEVVDTALPSPWDLEDEAFFLQDGPLTPLIWPEDAAIPRYQDHWEVRMATSTDGVTWEPEPRILAHSLSSLSALVTGAGLILVANPDAKFTNLRGVPNTYYAIYGLLTPDLESWGSAIWVIADAADAYIIDPALYHDADGGLHATYYSTRLTADDPVAVAGPHTIRSARWEGGFVEEGEIYSAEGLSDPVICRFDGQYWLAATEDASRIHFATSTDGQVYETSPLTWEGVSVPHCAADHDRLDLLAQEPDGWTAPQTASVSADATLSLGAPLYTAHPWGDNCTSPVTVFFQEKWALFCAVRVAAEPRPLTPGAL